MEIELCDRSKLRLLANSDDKEDREYVKRYAHDHWNLGETKYQFSKILDDTSDLWNSFDFNKNSYGFAVGEEVNGRVYAKMYDSATMQEKPHIFSDEPSEYDYLLTKNKIEKGKLYFGKIFIIRRSKGMLGVPYMFKSELELDVEDPTSISEYFLSQINSYTKQDMQKQFLFRLLTQNRFYFPSEVMWYLISDTTTERTRHDSGNQKEFCEELDNADQLKIGLLKLLENTELHTNDDVKMLCNLTKLLVLPNGEKNKGVYVLVEGKKLIFRSVYTLTAKNKSAKKLIECSTTNKSYLEQLRLDHKKDLWGVFKHLPESENGEILKVNYFLNENYMDKQANQVFHQCKETGRIKSLLSDSDYKKRMFRNYLWNLVSLEAKKEINESETIDIDKEILLAQFISCTEKCRFQLIDKSANNEIR